MPQPHDEHLDEMRLHRSRAARMLFAGLGTMFVGIGIAGAFLPVLPTTPFMLLAAACYARASERFYHWLLNNRAFGPTVREWRRYRTIPHRAKRAAIVMMVVTLTISILFFVPNPYLQAALALVGIALFVFLYRIPSRD